MTAATTRAAASSGDSTSPPPMIAEALAASPAVDAVSIGVSTPPGQTHETLTPCSAWVIASHSAKPRAACLVAA